MSQIYIYVYTASVMLCLCLYRKDEKEYALKQIEGTGISMSACREIAVSYLKAILFKLFCIPFFFSVVSFF